MASKRTLAAGSVALTGLLLLAGGDIAKRAVHGNGHWHQLATGLYHALKGQVASAALPAERADAPWVVYTDTLGDGWQDWSWGTRTLQATDTVHSGKFAIALSPGGNRGIFFHHDAYSTGGYGTLQAFVYGDTDAKVCLVDGGGKFGDKVPLQRYLKRDPSGRTGWQECQIPLADLGAPRNGEAITGIAFQPAISAPLPLLLDDISLLPDMTLAPAPTAATVAVSVNAAAGRHPISPYIYGMAFGARRLLGRLETGRQPLGRQ